MPIETYGVELHTERAQEAAERLDHALASDLFRCSIANRTFNLLWLNPPYDHDREDKRVEHAFLTHCSRYLEPDGVLVYIIPGPQVPTSARYLTTNYRRVRAWSFPEPEVEAFDQVVVIGVRKPQPRPDARAMQDLIASIDELASLRHDLAPEYDVGMSQPGPVMFTTRVIDFATAVAEARTRGLWTQDEITEAFWPPTDATARPLMPLRKGHLAMLVAARLPRQPRTGDAGVPRAGQRPNEEGDGPGRGGRDARRLPRAAAHQRGHARPRLGPDRADRGLAGRTWLLQPTSPPNRAAHRR